jgi:hypothetical protein
VNFLQLCQRTQLLLRTETARVGESPTTTLAQVGSLREIVEWVDMAYQDIQNGQEDWAFRTKNGTLTIASGQESYTLAQIQAQIADYDRIRPSTTQSDHRYILVYKTADGVATETQCWFVEYTRWRYGSLQRGTRASGYPRYFTVTPDGGLKFEPDPDASYTARFDYRRTVHQLSTIVSPAVTADANEPIIPAKYQMAIPYKTIADYYGMTRDVPKNVVLLARDRLNQEMVTMRSEQLPELELCGSLFSE